MNIVLYAMKVLALLPAARAGVQSAWEAMQAGSDAVKAMKAEDRDPTPEEWDALEAATDRLREALNTD